MFTHFIKKTLSSRIQQLDMIRFRNKVIKRPMNTEQNNFYQNMIKEFDARTRVRLKYIGESLCDYWSWNLSLFSRN